MAEQRIATTLSIWDALGILTLMAVCVVGIIFVAIFANPASAFNPFPPPTLPAAIVLPSDTPTPFYMPPTWTPIGNANSVEKVASQTPLPTTTGFVVPSFTSTFTETSTPTETPTDTETPEPSDTPKPPNTPKPTRTKTPGLTDLQISINSATVTGSSNPYDLSISITVVNVGTNRVSGASFTNTITKKVSNLSCTVSGASCKTSTSGSIKKSTASLKLDPGASIEITIKGTIPSSITSAFNDSVSVYPPSSIKDIDLSNNQGTISVPPTP